MVVVISQKQIERMLSQSHQHIQKLGGKPSRECQRKTWSRFYHESLYIPLPRTSCSNSLFSTVTPPNNLLRRVQLDPQIRSLVNSWKDSLVPEFNKGPVNIVRNKAQALDIGKK